MYYSIREMTLQIVSRGFTGSSDILLTPPKTPKISVLKSQVLKPTFLS